MRLSTTAVALAVLIAAVVVVWAVGVRRDLVRRLTALAARLGAPAAEPGAKGGLEAALSDVERAADAVVQRSGEAAVVAERLAETVADLSEGVVVCDEHEAVVYRNRRADDYVGTRHGGALAGEAVTAQLRAALQGEPGRRTLELFGPPRRTLVIHAFPLENGARRIGAAAVVEDVSERRRLESVRRDFVANISHELKTPVGALGLLAETILEEDDPDTVRRFALRMQTESLRVGRIIDDLLDLSRIEAEEHPLREPVRVQLVVAEAAERVRPLAERHDITVQAGEGSPGLTVLGDRRQLVSAVHNLLENAVKYSDPGSAVDVDVRADDGHVEVQVVDRGIGIPARDLERIFERFYRVDRARARDTGGTGLGLAIVRHVATNHRGEVRVTSHEGAGSTFTLRLPRVLGGSSVRVEAG